MALAARRRHVELKDRRLRVRGIENLVRAVTVGANRRFFRAGSDRVPVHAQTVRSHHLRALPAVLHDELLAMTSTAGRGNVGVVNARVGIAGRQQLMRAAMAIDASGGLAIAALDGFAMEAAIVSGLLVLTP